MSALDAVVGGAGVVAGKLAHVLGEAANDLKPYARGGLIDLQNVIVHAFPDSLQQASVLGQLGQETPQAVYQEQHQEFMKGIDEAAQRAPAVSQGMGLDR